MVVNLVASFLAGPTYFVIFLLFFFEGPIFSVIAGGVAASGFLNVWIVLGLSICGNVLGDIILYAIGRGVLRVPFKTKKPKPKNKHTLSRIEKLFSKHFYIALFITKALFTISIFGLLYIGKKRFSFKKFIFGSVVFTTIISSILVFLGYFFVDSIKRITYYFDVFQSVSMVLTIILVFIFVIWLFRNQLKRFIYVKILSSKELDVKSYKKD